VGTFWTLGEFDLESLYTCNRLFWCTGYFHHDRDSGSRPRVVMSCDCALLEWEVTAVALVTWTCMLRI
jgi:hypothetical protein